jgi:hypothetical protein
VAHTQRKTRARTILSKLVKSSLEARRRVGPRYWFAAEYFRHVTAGSKPRRRTPGQYWRKANAVPAENYHGQPGQVADIPEDWLDVAARVPRRRRQP